MSVSAKDILSDFDNQPKSNGKQTNGVSANDILADFDATTKKKIGGASGAFSGEVSPSTSQSQLPSQNNNWQPLEQSIINARDAYNNLEDSKKLGNTSFGEAAAPIPVGFSEKFEAEANQKLNTANKARDAAIQQYAPQLKQTIDNLTSGDKYKSYFDDNGIFNTKKAISDLDYIVKNNGGGSYLRDQMVATLKQQAQYNYDNPERQKLREEEYKKQGIDVSKYGNELLKIDAKEKFNNINALKDETNDKVNNLLESVKPKAVQYGKDLLDKQKELTDSVTNGSMSQEDAQKQFQQAQQQYNANIQALDKQYQSQVRNININTEAKYGRISNEINQIGKSITDEQVWNSIPHDEQNKIIQANQNVENQIEQGKESKRRESDKNSFLFNYFSLPAKATISGWFSGLANLGSYLSSKGYDNGFSRWLQGQQYNADVSQTGNYQYGEDTIKRLITSTGNSLGASLPILIPTAGVTLATGGLGAPETVGAIATGITSYEGEKAQNVGQVYQDKLNQTGDPLTAYKSAKDYENKQLITLPLYFVEGAGIQNLLKGGGVKKLLLGTSQELVQELPTEYYQNYTQAQQENGYNGTFTDYIKENPQTAVDIIAGTLGQSGVLGGAGKILQNINKLIPQSQNQYYADMVGKHGVEFAMENLAKQYQAGVLNDNELANEQQKVLLTAKKLKSFDGLGLHGDDAKAYYTLSEQANLLNKSIKESDDEGLKIAYQQKLDETKKSLEDLTKGKGAYAVVTMPGGIDETKIVPISQIQHLQNEGTLDGLIKMSDSIEVKGDDALNEQLQQRKKELGNPIAPDGFYSQPKNIENESEKSGEGNANKGNETSTAKEDELHRSQENEIANETKVAAETAETKAAPLEEKKVIPLEENQDYLNEKNKLDEQRASDLREANKPVIELERISNNEIAALDDPDKMKAVKEKQNDVFRRKKILEKLLDCV